MLMLISPAKIMKDDRTHVPKQLPIFLKETKAIHNVLRQYREDELKELMNTNTSIAALTRSRYQAMRFDMFGCCALDAYDGLQFKSMNLTDADDNTWSYLDQHLRILSGFYGMLRPSDSIYPYRLEMQTPISFDGYTQLYAYWMDQMANALKDEREHHKEPYIINLASKEYDRSVRSYFLDDTWIDIIFYIRKGNTYKTLSTQAKKARGQMVRYMADNGVEHIEDIKKFDVDGYVYDAYQSTSSKFIFVKNG